MAIFVASTVGACCGHLAHLPVHEGGQLPDVLRVRRGPDRVGLAEDLDLRDRRSSSPCSAAAPLERLRRRIARRIRALRGPPAPPTPPDSRSDARSGRGSRPARPRGASASRRRRPASPRPPSRSASSAFSRSRSAAAARGGRLQLRVLVQRCLQARGERLRRFFSSWSKIALERVGRRPRPRAFPSSCCSRFLHRDVRPFRRRPRQSRPPSSPEARGAARPRRRARR